MVDRSSTGTPLTPLAKARGLVTSSVRPRRRTRRATVNPRPRSCIAVRTHRPTPEFSRHLESLYAGFPFDRSVADDPISAIRPLAWDARRAEIAGIFASTLAIGNTTAIRGAIARLAATVDGDVARLVDPAWAARRRARLASFRHRWIRGDQLDFLAQRLSEIYESTPSLETIFLAGLEEGGFARALDALARSVRASGARNGRKRPPAGYVALFPSPLDRSGSPS